MTFSSFEIRKKIWFGSLRKESSKGPLPRLLLLKEFYVGIQTLSIPALPLQNTCHLHPTTCLVLGKLDEKCNVFLACLFSSVMLVPEAIGCGDSDLVYLFSVSFVLFYFCN